MAGGNQVVTSTVNKVIFDVDNTSYGKAIKAIKKVQQTWEGGSAKGAKNDPVKRFVKTSTDIDKVNRRLAETRKREEKKASDYRMALHKKEVKSAEAIRKQAATRFKQHVKGMTNKDHDISAMRKFYMAQQREAKKAGNTLGAPTGRRNPPPIITLPSAIEGRGTGMVGDAKKASQWDPERTRRHDERYGPHAAKPTPAPKPAPAPKPKAPSPAELKAARGARSRQDAVDVQDVRLRSKYGANYSSQLKGLQSLRKEFLAGSMSAAKYRASVSALEGQFRKAQSGAMSLGGAMGTLRSSMVAATASYGAFAAGKSVLQQGQFFQGLEATMLMVSDSSEEAGKRIQFVKDQSMRLGLSLKEASQGYVQMSIAADGVLSKTQNDDLFKGFSEYATALQVDPVKYQRGITAIQQMMGKGQIMAEELKQQLAEGIPGSMQVFVKAAQEAFGDTTIDVEKLMDKMQKGELKAAKVLPFVAKYYAQAAQKGGALEMALKGNRVAMQRLTQSWNNWLNAVFQGGFGERMTSIFNNLAKILSDNGSVGAAIGKFFSSFMEGLEDISLLVYNTFIFINDVFEEYAKKLGVSGDLIGKALDWGGYAAGVLLFVASATKLFNILKSIAGLAGALKIVKDATSIGGAVGAGGDGKGGKGGGAGKTKLTAMGAAGKALKVAFMYDVADSVADAAIGDTSFGQWAKNTTLGDVGSGIADWWNGESQKKDTRRLDYLQSNGLGPVSQAPTNPFPARLPVQEVEAAMTIKIDAGELQNMVQATVDQNNMFNINMLMQGGNTP